jgi:hypothetical protein
MTTTKPSQKDHLQQAVDVLEGENAELRQIASVLVLQILAWGPTVEPPGLRCVSQQLEADQRKAVSSGSQHRAQTPRR